jgi:hypothetical protein
MLTDSTSTMAMLVARKRKMRFMGADRHAHGHAAARPAPQFRVGKIRRQPPQPGMGLELLAAGRQRPQAPHQGGHRVQSSPFMKPSSCSRLVKRLKIETNSVTVAST